jgi:ABC transporter fused permease/ATP-binding protein
MSKPDSDLSPVPLSRLIALAKPELGLLLVASTALFIGSIASLAWPQGVRWLINALTEPDSSVSLDYATGLLLVLFAFQALFTMLRAWLFTVAGERIVARLRTDLYRAVIGQSIGFFDASRTGELTSRLVADTTVLQNTVTINVSMALRFTVQAIGALIIISFMSPQLTLIAMCVVPLVAIGAAVFGRIIRRLSRETQDALAQSTEIAEETLSAVRTVRAFAREGHETARYASAVQHSYRLAAKRALAYGGFNGTAVFSGYAALALVLWQGGHQVLTGDMSVGDLTAFLLYTLQVAMAMGALSSLYGDFMRASGASQRVFNLLDKDRGLESLGGRPVADVKGALSFQGLHFQYPTRPDIAVLSDFTLDIPPGKAVALVGQSGSGKSTIAQLVSRFYDPTDGKITLDGSDLRSLDPGSLREHIGVVSQEPVLFATSIGDNIRYGRQDATDEEVRQAARTANAESFIDEFPEGFSTRVGERGVRLSGGQKQRIAIARAVLKDPKILILDEATSALDAESEHLVQEALDRLMHGRTTLIIAHRLSTVRDADNVVVLSGGQVVESGTHDDLFALNGAYRRLVDRQFADTAA